MNVQEYISGGIVESYVFGLASQEEQIEFERMCAEYPEVKAAREKFELLLEEQAMAHAVQPPAYLKNKIFSDANIASEGIGNDGTSATDARPETPVITMYRMRNLAAASVILLLGSTALNFYFFNKYRTYIAKYDQLVATQTQLASANQNLQTKLKDYELAVTTMKDPDMKVVKMPGVPTSPNPGSLATVYWGNHSKDVYLLVNNLPQQNSDKQYQLWAIVDGKPVDAGVIDLGDGSSFVRMKNMPKAQAFAITLEKKGGSAAPTMSSMYVMGKVS